MTALAMDVRELSFDEIDYVSGGYTAPSRETVGAAVGGAVGTVAGAVVGNVIGGAIGGAAGAIGGAWLALNGGKLLRDMGKAQMQSHPVFIGA